MSTPQLSEILRKTSQCTRCTYPEMVLHSSSLRRRVPALFQYSDISTLSSLILLRGDHTVRWSSPPQMSRSFHICTEASRWTSHTSSLDRLGTMLLPLKRKSLSLSLFITRVVRYFDIDTSTTRRCSTTTILLDQMILRNIHMLRRVGDHFVIREILVDEPPAPEDEVPEEPLLSPHQVRHWSMPDATEPSSSVFTYHPQNTFKRFIVTSLTQQCESITQLTSQFQRTEQ